MGTKILIADDDEIYVHLMAFKLRKEGLYDIVTATNGKQAKKLAAEVRPEVIITDVMMPIASGLELIEFVREQLKLDAFIIAVSALGLESHMQEAYEMGADDYLTKPFDLNELLIKIKNLSSTNSFLS